MKQSYISKNHQNHIFELKEKYLESVLSSNGEISKIFKNWPEAMNKHLLSKYYMRGVIRNYLSERKFNKEIKRGRISPTTYFNENYLAIILKHFLKLKGFNDCDVEIDKKIPLGKKKNKREYCLYPDISVFSGEKLKVIISTKNDLGYERSNWADKFEKIIKSFTGINSDIINFDKQYQLSRNNCFLVVNTIENSKIKKKSDIKNSIKGKKLIVPSNVIFLLNEHPNTRKDDDDSFEKLNDLKDNLRDGHFINFLEPMFNKILKLMKR